MVPSQGRNRMRALQQVEKATHKSGRAATGRAEELGDLGAQAVESQEEPPQPMQPLGMKLWKKYTFFYENMEMSAL